MPAETVPGAEEQVAEETTLDPATSDDTGASQVEPTPAPGETAPAGEEAVDGILTDEEFEKLSNDPVALRKALVSDYTKKTQQVAGMRKFAEAFEADPQGAIRKLAAGVGISLPEPGRPGAPSSAEATQTLRDEFAAVLGEEAADKLLPIFDKMMQKRMEPVLQSQQTLAGQAALTQAEAVLETFEAKNPEWRKHEAKMVEISKMIQPARGTDPVKWMDMLYRLATDESSAADKTQQLIDRVTTSVRGSDSRTTGTQGTRVADRPPAKPTFDQAWAAGVRGKRFEH